ncbi:MAG TPA: OmpA family protein, partial [Kofleriaceae bacterium]|nr:OmpA family protein [Kofleriaceae bacterium]
DLPEETGGDKDGCPSHTYVKVENGELVIFGKVLFKTGSAEIQPKSAPLLDQIAVALKGSPDVGRVRIEGHTDDIGDEALNKSLSEERAASVRDALVERGVSEDRIEVRGYGESHPVAPNTTRAGRAKNRRVEFVITDK